MQIMNSEISKYLGCQCGTIHCITSAESSKADVQHVNNKLLPPASLGFLKEGCELINEALNLFNNVYGAMHVEICACLRLLARLNYIMGDHPEVHTHMYFSHLLYTLL